MKKQPLWPAQDRANKMTSQDEDPGPIPRLRLFPPCYSFSYWFQNMNQLLNLWEYRLYSYYILLNFKFNVFFFRLRNGRLHWFQGVFLSDRPYRNKSPSQRALCCCLMGSELVWAHTHSPLRSSSRGKGKRHHSVYQDEQGS